MQELINRLEKDKWHVSGVDIQEAINLIESQAAEIEKYKAMCAQMGKALEWYCRQNEDPDSQEILKAWRAMK